MPSPVRAAEIGIVWNDGSVNEIGFLVERRPAASGSFSEVGAVPSDLTEFVDTGLPAGAAFCYRVRAYNAVGKSAPTGEVCGTAAVARIPLTVTLATSEFKTRDTLVATVNAVGGQVMTPVDAYVLVQVGQGAMYSLQLSGQLVPGIVPIARSIVIPSGSLSFAFPLAGAPIGNYTWLAVATQPGTLTPVASISRTEFFIAP